MANNKTSNDRRKKLEELIKANKQETKSFFTEKKVDRSNVGQKQTDDSNKFKKESIQRSKTISNRTSNTSSQRSSNDYILPTRSRLGNNRAERKDYFKGTVLNNNTIGNNQRDTARKVFETLNPGKKIVFNNKNQIDNILPTRNKLINMGISAGRNSDSSVARGVANVLGGVVDTGNFINTATNSFLEAFPRTWQWSNRTAKDIEKGSSQDKIKEYLMRNYELNDYLNQGSTQYNNINNEKQKSLDDLVNHGTGLANLKEEDKNNLKSEIMQIMNKHQNISMNNSDANTRGEQLEEISKAIEKYMGLDYYDKKVDKTQEVVNAFEKDSIDNIENSNTGLGKIATEKLAPAIGNSATALIPGAGGAIMFASSSQQYYEDAKQRGMTDEKANVYGNIMGLVEAGTEAINVSNLKSIWKSAKTLGKYGTKEIAKEIINKGVSKETENLLLNLGQTSFKNVLKETAIGTIENGAQEFLTEYIQEGLAQFVDKKGEFDGLFGRACESFAVGALTELLPGLVGGTINVSRGRSQINNSQLTNFINDMSNDTVTEKQIDLVAKEISKEIGENESDVKDTLTAVAEAYKETKENVRQQIEQKAQQTQAKQDITERINNSNLSEEDKSNMLNYIQNEDFTQADYDAMMDKVEESNNKIILQENKKINKILSKNSSFENQLELYKSGKMKSSDILYLGETPEIYTKLGLKQNPITLLQRDLKKIITEGKDETGHEHGVPIDTLKNLPKSLENPLNILKSKDKNGNDCLVVITDLADSNERPVIASILINDNGQIGSIHFDTNRLTSAYGKREYDDYMKRQIEAGNMLYDIDEGIIKELPTSTRVQFPEGLSSSVDTNNNVSTSNKSIPFSTENVNTINKSMQITENNAQNYNLPTKGESINWNEIERPEGKFRKHYQSIIQSSNTTAQAKAVAKEMMGLDTYVPQSNTELLQKADNRISETNAVNELNSLYSRVMNNEKVNDVDIAVGERLIEYFSKTGDAENLQTAIHTTAMAGTQAGRVVQAMALLNHMTPRGQVVWLQRSIDKMNNELQQKYKNKKDIPQFELTSEMTEKILNTENQEEMFDVLDDIYEELGQQVPKSFSEKIDEWRYFSMLANVKTHARNMIGNVAMGATQRIKNKVAGAIEGTVAKFNPEMERTHSIRKASKEVKEFAKNDVKNMDVQTELGMNENKYNPQSRLQNSRRTFKNKALEKTVGKLFDLNSTALEVEDNIGLKSMYVSALSDYLTANKIDVKNMTDAQLAKARQHAIKEAQEATFHQASAIATALTQMGNKNKYAKFFLDAAVPFKKTPVNVAKTGIQYSPVGLMKSAIFDVSKVRKGTMTVNQYIDNISKGLTGTGITFLGYVLAQAGILKASGEDDEKKENYDKEQGRQSYSLEIGGKTASLDWLSPVGIPLFIGAEINQQFNSSKKEKNSKSNDDDELLNQVTQRVFNIANASANAMNPMSEMSMISGLTSVLSSYNKENAVGDMIVNTGKSYVNQFLPTAVKQLARTTDKYERSTKSTKTGALPKAVDSTINQIKSGLPGIRKTLPVKTDIWGQEVKQQENLPFRAFNNFINPAIIKDVSINEVDKELNDLYSKTKESSIIPKSIEKTFSFDGTNYRMTNEEYSKYNKKYGETSYNLIKGLVKSSNYKKLTDEQKQKAIESVYSYAKEQNKVDYAKENNIKVDTSTLYNTMKALESGRGNQSNYLDYISKTSGAEIKEKQKINTLYNANYDDITKDIIYSNTIGKDDKAYKKIKEDRVPVSSYLKYKDLIYKETDSKRSQGKLNDEQSLKSVDKIKILLNSNFSANDKKSFYSNTVSDDDVYRKLLKDSVDIDEYLNFKEMQLDGKLASDKDKYGQAKRGTSKKKFYKYVNSKISGYNNKLIIIGKNYKLTNAERKKLVNIINSNTTSKDRINMYKKFSRNFIVNGKKVYYK